LKYNSNAINAIQHFFFFFSFLILFLFVFLGFFLGGGEGEGKDLPSIQQLLFVIGYAVVILTS
jgi:hypothetical protein